MTDYTLPVGLLASSGAVGLLRAGWRGGTAYLDPRVFAGWLLVGCSLFLLSFGFGIVIGCTIALIAFSVCGFVAVLLNVERRTPRGDRKRFVPQAVEVGDGGHWWHRGLAAFFLAMIAALAVGSAGAGIPLGQAANRVTIGGIVLPVLWAGFIIWTLADARLRRPVIGLTGVVVTSAGAIAIEWLS